MTGVSLPVVPVDKGTGLAEQIVRQLVTMVKSGVLKPGARLPAERHLSRDLGVGRPTLREALRALQLLGILDIRHGGGVFVAEIQPDTLLGPLHLFLSLDRPTLSTILEARKVIEGALLAYVAVIIDEPTIAGLEQNLAEFEALIDAAEAGSIERDRIHELAQAFRNVLEEAIANPILARSVRSLDLLSEATRSSITSTTVAKQLLHSHRRMLEALINHDPQAATAAFDAHIDILCSACDVTLREQHHV